MLPTVDKITDIIHMKLFPCELEKRDLSINTRISEAAEAIAALTTRAAMMSWFVRPSLAENTYFVPDKNGAIYCVRIEPDGEVLCWLDGSETWQNICSDGVDGTTCDHVKAVKLYLAREEAGC